MDGPTVKNGFCPLSSTISTGLTPWAARSLSHPVPNRLIGCSACGQRQRFAIMQDDPAFGPDGRLHGLEEILDGFFLAVACKHCDRGRWFPLRIDRFPACAAGAIHRPERWTRLRSSCLLPGRFLIPMLGSFRVLSEPARST